MALPLMHHRARMLVAVGCVGLLSACSTVGPDYARPETQISGDWIGGADAGEVPANWWRQFDDPLLTALIEEALQSSPTVAEAEARLAEARAGRDAVAGQTLPQVQAQGSATENRLSENGALPVGRLPGFDPSYSLFDLGFDASWEIDLWGRRTREIEAANARAGAAEEGYREVRIRLAAEIARSYFDLRRAQAELAARTDIAESDSEIAKLTALLARAGMVPRDDSNRADAAATSAAAAMDQTRAMRDAATFALATLLGKRPEDVIDQLQQRAPIPQPPLLVQAGLRSELLRRRPDVARAERELAAATADIGVATADLFPRFSLLGGIGSQARSVGNLADGDSLRYQIGPSFSWPIFSGGSIRAQIRAADARAEAAAARYEQAVVTALNDSEGALNRLAAARYASELAQKAEDSMQRAFNFAEARFKAGEDSRIDLEQARKQWAEARMALSAARTAEAQAAAALYKALGAPIDLAPAAE